MLADSNRPPRTSESARYGLPKGRPLLLSPEAPARGPQPPDGSGIALGTIPTSWTIGTTADLNGDGKTDLVWQNTVTGESSVWLMNGGALTSGVALDTLPGQWRVVGTGDFNADGKADLLLHNTGTGERAVRLMNRTTLLSTVSLGTSAITWSIRN